MRINTPPMGWNTWNTFGENIDEKLILETADAMVEKGYRDAGYEYLIIDDCWSEMKRDENGRLVPDKKKFPHGMKYIADYIHSKGLKFGMYSDAGFYTCAGYPASYGHEITDAQTFAEWEIDYLKYDFGFFPNSANAQAAYLTMAQALRMTGRDIIFTGSTGGVADVSKWALSRGCHTYRSTDDISDSKASFMRILESQADRFESDNCINDMDMLTVGMNGSGNVAADGENYHASSDTAGMKYQDYESQFLAWAFFGTPLIIGADIRKIDEKCRELLLNKEVISINQDPENRPPFRIEKFYDHAHVFARLLNDGDIAILAVNFHAETPTQKSIKLKIAFDDLGIRTGSGYGLELTNVLTGEKLGTFEGGYGIQVESDRAVLLRGKIVPFSY